MKAIKTVAVSMFIILASGSALSQTSGTDATPLTTEEALTFIKGKNLSAARTAGGNPQLQFKEDGMMYGSNGGSSDSGKWRVEDGRLCMSWRKWEYEGCGQLLKVGAEIHHLYPAGGVHLIFRP
jgi:hypothetical protein